MRYRIRDNVEKKYSDKDFFLDQDGKLYLKCKIYTAPYVTTRDWTAVEPADPDRYTVEKGTEINGQEVYHNDIAFITDPYATEFTGVEREIAEKLLKRKYKILWTGISFTVELIHNDPNAGTIRHGFPKDCIIEVTGTIHDTKESNK